MTHPTHDDALLRVLDRTMLIAAPLVGLAAVIRVPSGSRLGIGLFALLLVTLWVLAALGYWGRAPWRRTAYPIALLVGAMLALWASGPLAGAGATFGLVALVATVLLSRRGLVVIVGLSVAAIAARATTALGWWFEVEPRVVSFDIVALWVRISLITGLLMWIATRVLTELVDSLEHSYTAAAQAYQIEREARRELAHTRAAFDHAEQIELVGRLAGGVAHDVNNALTAILAASDILIDDLETEPQREALAELEASSHHAAELVRDLLWIGRQLPPGTDDALVEAAVAACRTRLDRARKIELDVQLGPSLRVKIAAARLEQILYWLVLRADRAGTRRLALTAHAAGEFVEIVLGGCVAVVAVVHPIAPREPLRAQLSTTAAEELVALAGGTLVRHEHGDEVRVVIRLPTASAADRLRATEAGHARTALVVDDEPAILGRLAQLVARRGYRVVTATSLAEAWPLLEAADLLVTDLQLGDGCGDELAIAMFRAHPDRSIVVCSGFAAEDGMLDQLRGANLTFLSKPFTRAEFERAVPQVGAAAA